MNRYQLRCSCVHCHTETTVQSLSSHINRCTKTFTRSCETCGGGTNNPRFCSHSCRAKAINATRTTKRSKSNKPSQQELRMQRFMRGEIKERSILRKYLTLTEGYRCVKCGVSDWCSDPITLIVDHVDGDAGNNYPANLRLLCPNCNSQTPTFGGRNKGNGRKARGLPLH